MMQLAETLVQRRIMGALNPPLMMAPIEVRQLRDKFNALVEATQQPVLSYAQRLTGDKSQAQDLFMEAWFEVLEYFPTIKSKNPISFGGYFKRVVKSRFIKQVKARARFQSIGDFDEIANSEPPASDDHEPVAIDLGLLMRLVELLCSATPETPLGKAARNRRYQQRQVSTLIRPSEQATSLADPLTEVCLNEISQEVGRSRLWVANRLHRLGVPAVARLDKTGRTITYFSRTVISTLREMNKAAVVAEGRSTIPAIASRVGRDRSWVINQLNLLGEAGEAGYSEKSGRVDLTFSRLVIDQLRIKAQVVPLAEPGWHTKRGLREQLQTSDGWVRRRLNYLPAEAQLFRDQQGVVREYYPPKTLTLLKRLKEGLIAQRQSPKWYEVT